MEKYESKKHLAEVFFWSSRTVCTPTPCTGGRGFSGDYLPWKFVQWMGKTPLEMLSRGEKPPLEIRPGVDFFLRMVRLPKKPPNLSHILDIFVHLYPKKVTISPCWAIMYLIKVIPYSVKKR